MKVDDTTYFASSSQYTDRMNRLFEFLKRLWRSTKNNPDQEWLLSLPANALPFVRSPSIMEDPKTQAFRRELSKSLRCGDEYFEAHIKELIIWLFCHTQGLPASLNDHHRQPYGLFYHSLEVALQALKQVKTNASYHPTPSPKDHERRQTLQDCRVYIFLLSISHDLYKVSNEMEILIHLPGRAPIKFNSHLDAPFANGLYHDLIDLIDIDDDLTRNDIERCRYSHHHVAYRENKFHKEGLLPFAEKALRDIRSRPLPPKLTTKHFDWSSEFLSEVTFPIIEAADKWSCQEDIKKRPITTEEIILEHQYILVYWAENNLLDRLDEPTDKYFLRRHLLSILLTELPDMKDWLNAKTTSPEDFARLLKVANKIEHLPDPNSPSEISLVWNLDGVHEGVYLIPKLTSDLRDIQFEASKALDTPEVPKAAEAPQEPESKPRKSRKMKARKTNSENHNETNVISFPNTNTSNESLSINEQGAHNNTPPAKNSTSSATSQPRDISSLGDSIPPPPSDENQCSPETNTLDPDACDDDTNLQNALKSEANRANKKHPKKRVKQPVKSDRASGPTSAPTAFRLLDSLFKTDIDNISVLHATFTESGSLLIDRKYLSNHLGEMKCSSPADLLALQAYCSEHYSSYWTLTGSRLTNLELSQDYLSLIGYGGEPQNSLVSQINRISDSSKPATSSLSNDAPNFTANQFEQFLLNNLGDVIPGQSDPGVLELPMSLLEAYVVDKALKGQALNSLKKSGLLLKHTKTAIFLDPSHLESPHWQRA